MKSPNAGKPLRIDVIAENGSEWIKVIARNPKALKDIALGCSNFGSKSILDHAEQYVECAKINQHLFQTPKVRKITPQSICMHFENSIVSHDHKIQLILSPVDCIPLCQSNRC